MDLASRTDLNVYDASGQLTAQQNPLGLFTSFGYDATGQQTAVIDARSHVVTSLFDARGSLLATQDPLGALTSYAYDAVGNAVLRTDARGIVTTMSYDALDREVGLLYPAGTRVTYLFDAAGQQTVMADLTGITSYSYDRAGRQTSVIYPTGQSLTLTLDAAGRRTRMQEASGALSTYTYAASQDGPQFLDDPQGVKTRFQNLNGGVEYLNNYQGGTVYTHGHVQVFDTAGQVWLVRELQTGSFIYAQHNLFYDPAGQVRQDVENGPLNASHIYAYDNAGQLTNERLTSGTPYNLTYSYDPTGNRLAKLDGTARTTYVYDAANQLQTETLGAAITTYGYDANGNRATVSLGSGITSYIWDEENRLTGIAYPDATIATYLYSADGLRQRKIDSSGTVNYLWDEGRVLQETDASLVEIVRYSHGTVGWNTLVSQRRGGVDSFFGFDLVGNTRLLVDLAGNTTDTTVYESFGAERASTGSTVNTFRFGGQVGYQRDEATRLYVRARHLDTARGGWISRDPIGFDGGDWNLYRYVGNGPVSGADPSGLAKCTPCSIAQEFKTKVCGRGNQTPPFSCSDNKKSWRDVRDGPPNQICKKIRQRIAGGTMCLAARYAVTTACYGGEQTKSHEDEEWTLYQTIDQCAAMYAIYFCGRKPWPRIRRPVRMPIRVNAEIIETRYIDIRAAAQSLIDAGIGYAAIAAWLILAYENARSGRPLPPLPTRG